MTTTTATKKITVHPFDDEWLWTDAGDEPERFATVDEAAAFASSHRKENLERNREDADQVKFIESMWFALHQDDPAVEEGEPSTGRLVALVSPDAEPTLYVGRDAEAILAKVGRSGEWPGDEAAHGEGCECDDCAHVAVIDTFSGATPLDPRCPNCGAGMDELELDDEDQRAFCSRCAAEGPAEAAIHEGIAAASERWMVCLDGGPDRDGDDDLDRWDALMRARSLRVGHPEAVVTMVLLPREEAT